jgi:hypothetical protein
MSPVAALADEGGGSFWVPGQYGSFAAAQTDPGWSIQLQNYVSQGRVASGTLSAARNGVRVNGRNQVLDVSYATPGYTFDTSVLGGQLYVGATFGYAWIDNKVDSVVSRPVTRRKITTDVTTETNVDDSGWGTVDINPLATLKWEFGVNNLMTYLTGNIPSGYFDPSSISTPGLGFWAIDGGLGYTYNDTKRGLEFSAVAGVTYNFENPWSWQSGVDGHIDLAASWAVADPFYIGAVGYVYRQLSGDVGAPTDLGAHLSGVLGAGPQLGWSFQTGNIEVDVNVRGYAEFAAENRPQGYAAWFTVTLQQIKPKRKSDDGAMAPSLR